jgi:O-antigen/teichoic acid export membrane protein
MTATSGTTHVLQRTHAAPGDMSEQHAGRLGLSGAVGRGVSWVALGHVIGQLSWFGSLVFVAALLPPHSFGSVAIAMVMMQVAWLIVGSGTRGSIVTGGSLTRAQVDRTLALNVGSGVAAGLVVAALARPLVAALSPGANVDVVRILALSICFYGASIVPLALLQKAMRFKAHAGAHAGAAILASSIAVGAALIGAGVWALVLRQILFQVLLAAFAWAGARRLLPRRRPGERALRASRPAGAPWFFGVTVISFLALNLDYVIVGRYTDVAQLGLYSLAFTIAFAPVTQFAWQIGKVLLPAAARTETLASVGTRATKAVQASILLLLPAVPPMIALAPVVLPALLGPEWKPMVLPFQILLVAGVSQAVLAILREFLLGSGSVAFCVRVDAVWLLAMVAALFVAVPLIGIRGAALTHLAVLVPLAFAYCTAGARRMGSSWRLLCRPLVPLLAAVAAEAVLLSLTVALASAAGTSAGVARVTGALLGLVAVGLILWQPQFRDSRVLLTRLRPRESA